MAKRRSTKKSSGKGILSTIATILVGIATLVLVQLGIIKLPDSSATTIPGGSGDTGVVVGEGDTPWLKVYFTNPNPPDNQANGIDRMIVTAIQGAKKSIDVASFDLNLPSIVSSLIDAKKRGVTVRVVMDLEEGNFDLEENATLGIKAFNAVNTLRNGGISVVDGGRSNGLMHNKMVIIDGATLFGGSWNLAYNDTFRNNNNILQITNQRIIANYQAKFNEMYVDKLFGARSTVKALNPKLTIDGTPVENYFSPDDEIMAKLVQEVNNAKKSVKFMVFTYTHPDLSAAMIARFKAGVTVQGVIENRGASQGALPALFCAKIPVKTDGNKYTMHHKVIIIDDSTVITGSYNMTKSADDSNDDNVIIIRNKSIAALYLQEFDRMYNAGVQPTTTC